MGYVITTPMKGTDLVFPQDLPPPTISGYSSTLAESTMQRSERDIGVDRVRRVFVNPVRQETVSWDFSELELQQFELWYEVYCQGGTLRFDVLLSDYDDSNAWSTAQFLNGYRTECLQPGLRWRVDAQLILYGRPFYDRTGPTLLSGRAYRKSEATAYFDNLLDTNGRASGGWEATGALSVDSSWGGRANMTPAATGQLQRSVALDGRAEMTPDADLLEVTVWAYDGTDIVSSDGTDQVEV